MNRVTIIAPEFPPETGGMQVYAAQFCAQYARRGWAVTVLTRADLPPHPLPGETASHPVLQGNRLDDWPAIRAHLERDRLCHVMTAPYAWVARRHRPTVVSLHGKDLLAHGGSGGYNLKKRLRLSKGDRLNFLLDRLLTRHGMGRGLRKAFLIVANSHYTARQLERIPGGPHAPVEIVHPGISGDFLESAPPEGIHRDPLHWITVARLDEPRKAVDAVLAALAQLPPHIDYQYHVVGEGSLRPSLQRQAASLGIAGRVTFHGYLEPDALQERLRRSGLFILTSRADDTNFEGFGIVYLEANACGVPVLASRLGGTEDAIEEGVSGWLVDEPRPEWIAEKLRAVAAGSLTTSAEACRAHAEQFTWEKTTTVFFRKLDSLSGRPPKAKRANA